MNRMLATIIASAAVIVAGCLLLDCTGLTATARALILLGTVALIALPGLID